MERSYEGDDMDDIEDSDRDRLPTWFPEPRGFIDKGTVETEVFSRILDAHLPVDVLRWEKTDSGWTFLLGHELTIEIRGKETNHLTVVASSSSMSRKWLDHVRTELRSILHGHLTRKLHAIELAVILLQLAEAGVASVRRWREVISNQRANERSAASANR